jgi:N-acetylmuramoyl-L-alanine amidase
MEGEARARKLLAHWSGRTDDHEKAAEAQKQIERERRPKPAPLVAQPVARAKDGSSSARGGRALADQSPARPTDEHHAQPVSLNNAGIDDKEGLALTLEVDGDFRADKSVIPKTKDRGGRVYFDLRPVHAARAALRTIDVNKGGIGRVRVGQFDEETVRVVIDADGELSNMIELLRGGRPRILLAARDQNSASKNTRGEEREGDKGDEKDETPPIAAPLDAAHLKNVTSDVLRQIVKDMKRSQVETDASIDEHERPSFDTEELAEVDRREEPEQAIDVDPDPAALQRSTRDAARPRDRSVLCIRRVVIDAGHGGKDFGALGAHGLREKDVNLAIAMKLGRELKRRLGVHVIYTRTTDDFVSLQRRTMIANRSNADLFVSVHANAHKKRSVSGIETYFLNTTSDHYAERLAQRENTGSDRPDGLGGRVGRAVPDPGAARPDAGDDPEPGVGMLEQDEGSLPSGALGRDLRLILADLAMRSASLESKRLAGYVQSTLVSSLGKKHGEVRDLGVKHALFYVLLGARMPSVLIETGFVTHPNEAKLLQEAQYQAEVSSAIASGIIRFAQERAQIAKRAEGDDRALVAVRGR